MYPARIRALSSFPVGGVQFAQCLVAWVANASAKKMTMRVLGVLSG
jgi:hypothetical protein